MPTVDTGPLLQPADEVRFLESHRPTLPDGDFEITLTQQVTALELQAERRLTFSVAGPRFTLQPDDIASQFPPKGADGDFERVLPHVILSRSTLPWERTALYDEPTTLTAPTVAEAGDSTIHHPAPPEDSPAWLALLLFTEEEISGRDNIVSAADLLGAQVGVHVDPPAAGANFAPLLKATCDDPDTPVHVLDLPAALVQKVLPTPEDLRWLASARQVNQADGRGVIMANRLPQPGKRNIVHLVSVEHQYRLLHGADTSKHWSQTHQHWSTIVSPGPTVRFVSLAQWDFHCTTSPGDLQSMLVQLSVSSLSLSTSNLSTTTPAVYEGHVPVEHQLDSGERAASWYRGPFSTQPRNVSLALPTRHSRDLIQLDEFSGMAKISYSAAWELGRLLALKSPFVSVGLNQWKRQVAHAAHQAAQGDVVEDLGHPLPASPILPPQIADWFDKALGCLASVPADYLLPDPTCLPAESLAWFSLDSAWMAALYDGAFSIGRGSERQLTADHYLRYALPVIGPRSGCIVRSRVVSLWPDLLIDGYRQEEGGSVLLKPIRFERIGPDTRLVLFSEPIVEVALHLHPQALHFGFDGSFEEGFKKDTRAVHYRSGAERVVDIDGLARLLGKEGSHDFSLSIVEGVPRVSHRMSVPHA